MSNCWLCSLNPAATSRWAENHDRGKRLRITNFCTSVPEILPEVSALILMFWLWFSVPGDASKSTSQTLPARKPPFSVGKGWECAPALFPSVATGWVFDQQRGSGERITVLSPMPQSEKEETGAGKHGRGMIMKRRRIFGLYLTAWYSFNIVLIQTWHVPSSFLNHYAK